MSNTVHAVGSEITGGVVVATTQARCNKKNVQSGMTISSNWEDVTCGSCLKTYVRHDGRKNSPLTLLEYEHEYVTKVGELEEQERLSICCGADEDENIENMCSACHESTTFEVPHRNLDGSLGEMPPEPETPLLDDNFLPIPEPKEKGSASLKLEVRDSVITIRHGSSDEVLSEFRAVEGDWKSICSQLSNLAYNRGSLWLNS